MIGNQIESYKVVGIRDMNMNADLKILFDEIDPRDIIRKPYFNDAKETFWILSENYFRLTADLNEHKSDWETMNTRKIKVIFNAQNGVNDYGTRIQIKCHQKIERISQTLVGERCVNWEFMDSFGIRSVNSSVVHKFYKSVNWRGIGLRLKIERRQNSVPDVRKFQEPQ